MEAKTLDSWAPEPGSYKAEGLTGSLRGADTGSFFLEVGCFQGSAAPSGGERPLVGVGQGPGKGVACKSMA